MVDKIRADGGEIYAVTSEPQRLADDAKDQWMLNFETVGDPHHEIPKQCQDKGWLELIVNKSPESVIGGDTNLAHPKGYFQPGVLCLDANQRVLYRWRSIPTRKNIGGAVERPTAAYVYGQLRETLDVTDKAEDAALDMHPEMDSEGKPWPVFITLLLANGWFIKPKTFLLTNSEIPVQQRMKNALLRIPLFFAAWILALATLPVMWVVLAAIAYAFWITPSIRLINQQFKDNQNPDG